MQQCISFLFFTILLPWNINSVGLGDIDPPAVLIVLGGVSLVLFSEPVQLQLMLKVHRVLPKVEKQA